MTAPTKPSPVSGYLTRREAQVLSVLRDGELVLSEDIQRAVWGTADASYLSGLKAYILRLRRKGYPIQNVWGQGYILHYGGRYLPCPMCGRPWK